MHKTMQQFFLLTPYISQSPTTFLSCFNYIKKDVQSILQLEK